MQENSDALDLRGHLAVLRRRWGTLLLPLVLAVAATAAVTFTQTPIYRATTEVALEPVRDSDSASLQELILGQDVIATQVHVLTSDTVSQRVIENLGIDANPRDLAAKIEVNPVSNTRVVRISATDDDPQFAAMLANGYATSYFEHRRARALDEIAAARESLRERAQELEEQLADVEQELRLDGFTASEADDEDSGRLLRERDTLTEQLAQVENQLAVIGGDPDDLRGGGEVLVTASAPGDPVVPQPLRNLALATALGLFLGIAVALLRDHLDDAIRTEDDVRRATRNATVVGRVRAWDDDRAGQRLITLAAPYAGASEEFQALAANIRFALVSRSGGHATAPGAFAGHSLAITSSSRAEGKTAIASNLAVAAAGAGHRVILVGGDLRDPRLPSRFGVPEGVGLTDLVTNANTLPTPEATNQHLIDVGIPRLRLLPCGPIPPNPAELLASAQMAGVHESLEQMADLIIYDTPPVLPVADTLELSQHVDLVFLVVHADRTHRRDLSYAVERLENVGAELGGLVLNGLTTTRGTSGYGYGYDGYRPQGEYRPRTSGAQPDTARRRRRGRRTSPKAPNEDIPVTREAATGTASQTSFSAARLTERPSAPMVWSKGATPPSPDVDQPGPDDDDGAIPPSPEASPEDVHPDSADTPPPPPPEPPAHGFKDAGDLDTWLFLNR